MATKKNESVVEEAPKVRTLDDVKRYNLTIMFTSDVLGSSPSDPDVYKQFIASKVREETAADEVEALKAVDREQIGWTVWQKDEKGLVTYDYRVRGFFKEAARAVTGKAISAAASKIDKWLFVFPRALHLYRDGAIIQKVDDMLERPLRAMTMQGPRVSVARSDVIKAGASFKCQLVVLPLGQREISEEQIRAWLDYGQYAAFGNWRSAGYGRMTYELAPADVPLLES